MITGSGEVGIEASGSSFALTSRGDDSNGLDSEGGLSLERIVLLKLGERSGKSISWEGGRSISSTGRRRPRPGFRWMKSVSPTYLFLSFFLSRMYRSSDIRVTFVGELLSWLRLTREADIEPSQPVIRNVIVRTLRDVQTLSIRADSVHCLRLIS